MANRFWVGGTGTWDGTTTTHWSATSGGAGGASVPTSLDDVFIDVNSGTGTITGTGGGVCNCKTLTCTGYTGTLTAGTVSVSGNVTLSSGMTATGFLLAVNAPQGGTATMTSAGRTVNAVNFSGAGTATGVISLADALSMTGTFTHSSGGFATNNFAVTCGSYSSSNSSLRTLTLGSSAVTITGTGTPWNASTATNLTVTANTATITFTGAAAIINQGVTVGHATGDFNGASIVMSGSGINQVQGTSITCANFTRTGTAAKTDQFTTTVNLTCNGTFAINGNSATNRLLVTGQTGIQRTVTAAAVVSSNADFMDIAGAGAANWDLSAITGGSGDAGGNSGITFTASATQYRVNTVSSQWSANGSANGYWASSSGGVLGTGRVPLPQDDVVLDANTGTFTMTGDQPRSGRSIDFTGFAGTWTLSTANIIYGSLTLASGMTLGGGNVNFTFGGRSAYTINFAGKLWFQTTTFSAPGGTYTLQAAYTSTASITHNFGTLDANGFNVTFTTFASTNSNVRSIKMGSGTWTATSVTAAATVWNLSTPTNLTFDAGTSTLTHTGTTASTITLFWSMGSAALVYNNISLSTAQTTITHSFSNGMTVNGVFTATVGHLLTFSTSPVFFANVPVISGSAGSLVMITGSQGASNPARFRPTATATLPFNLDYLSLLDVHGESFSGSTTTSTWFAGHNSVDGGDNTGWTFGTGFLGAAVMSVSTSMSATGIIGDIGAAAMTVNTSMSASALLDELAVAIMAVSTSMAATGKVDEFASAAMNVTALMTLAAILDEFAAASMSVTTSMTLLVLIYRGIQARVAGAWQPKPLQHREAGVWVTRDKTLARQSGTWS